MRPVYPYGYSDYDDGEDFLTRAEVGRLVLDNSRDSDGTYRRGQVRGGYFAEIAPMMGRGFVGPGAWSFYTPPPPTSDAPTTAYRTPGYGTGVPMTATGPSDPLRLPDVTVLPSDVRARVGQATGAPVSSSAADAVAAGVARAMQSPMAALTGGGRMNWLPVAAIGLAVLGIGAAVVLGSRKTRRTRRRT